ncbi:MAG: hypothetical protein RR263_04520, partial [Oscillospiraceae bacterium]
LRFSRSAAEPPERSWTALCRPMRRTDQRINQHSWFYIVNPVVFSCKYCKNQGVAKRTKATKVTKVINCCLKLLTEAIFYSILRKNYINI